MGLERYILNLYQIGNSLEETILKIVKDKESYIVGLVKNRLYQYGRDGDGNEILPSYAPATIQSKKERSQRTSHVTLRDTGLFYKGFYLELEGNVLILNSSDWKASLLADKYGNAILEFTVQEQEIIFSIIEVGIEKLLREAELNASSSSGIDIDTF